MTYESERFVGHGGWDLESAGDGAKLTYRFVGKGKGIMSKLMMPIMMPMVKRQSKRGLQEAQADPRVQRIETSLRGERARLQPGFY